MRSLSLTLVASCFGLMLSGCGIGSPAADPAGLPQTGMAMGGRQPISGGHVYVMQVGTGGNAGRGIAASSSNASVNLLTAGDGSDSLGTYVLTNSSGIFTLTSKYACTPGTAVYVLANQGDPGVGSNNAVISLMAVLGVCPASGDFSSAVPNFIINERTTVAAAYALAGWATDSTHISSDSGVGGNTTAASAATGVKNAALNAAQLVNIVTGMAYTTTPNGGFVSSTPVGTIGNILAACVNSLGDYTTSGSNCYKLFNNATNNGTPATDTASAAINIAHYPGNNVATLYGLQTATSPFADKYGSTPNDFAIGIYYRASSQTGTNGIAVDASGNVWVSNSSGGTSNAANISAYSPQGATLSGTGGYLATASLNHPAGLAFDGATGYLWITDYSNYRFVVVDPASPSTVLHTYSINSGTGTSAQYIAFDKNGYIWAGAGASVYELRNDNTYISPSTGNGWGGGTNLSGNAGIAADNLGNVWIADYNTYGAKFNSTGFQAHYATGGGSYNIVVDGANQPWVNNYGTTEYILNLTNTTYSTATINNGSQIFTNAVDGDSNIWIPTRNGYLYWINSAGVTQAPTSGINSTFNGLNGSAQRSVATDSSGNLWVLNSFGNDYIVQMIGIAGPVVTPMALAASSAKVGARP